MRLSRRLDWRSAPNRLTRLREEKLRSGRAILDLTESNPTRAGFPYPEAEILQALHQPGQLLYQPSPAGLLSAREAVSRYYGERGLAVPPERILLAASTSEGYSFLFKLLCDPGDSVLVPRPSYPLLDDLAALESVGVAPYPLVYDGAWSIDLAGLEEALSERSRAVVVVNPNNPTGSFLSRGDRAELLRVCREHELALIADEVFADYPLTSEPEPSRSLVEEDRVPTFVLSGLSKIAGLPQMKLGWLTASGPEWRRALEALERIADSFLSVSTAAQTAAGAFLGLARRLQPAIRERTSGNYSCLTERVPAGSPCQTLRAEGGWYAVLRLPAVRTSEEWALALLADQDVFVHPGYLFDFPAEAYLVVSLLTPSEPFAEGVRRIWAHASGG